MNPRLFIATLLLALVSACGQGDDAPAEPPASQSVVDDKPSVYDTAVAATDRLPGDYERDAGRRPAVVLEFFGVRPGQTVLELFSGGGYYTELLSRVVGPDGKVIAQTNEAYVGFAGEEFVDRHADGRLGNVDILMAENNELEIDAASIDVVTIVLGYHDLYYAAPERGWPKFDVKKLLAELYQGLKPGGVLGIVDHMAEPGSPRETGGTVHRIDAAAVIEDLEAAGFVLDATSGALRNPDDDYSMSVFDPSVRGNTDRFVLRFVKPN